MPSAPASCWLPHKVLILRAGRAEAFGPPKDVLRRLLHGSNGAQPASQPVRTAQGHGNSSVATSAAEKGEEAAL